MKQKQKHFELALNTGNSTFFTIALYLHILFNFFIECQTLDLNYKVEKANAKRQHKNYLTFRYQHQQQKLCCYLG